MDDPKLEFGRDETEYEAADVGFREKQMAQLILPGKPAGSCSASVKSVAKLLKTPVKPRAFIPTMWRPSNSAT